MVSAKLIAPALVAAHSQLNYRYWTYQAGREFGSTTGRPRRCGWIDLPSLRYSIMLNGVTELHLMKADVLDDFAEIQVCTHYRTPDGQDTDLPDRAPIYKIFQELKICLLGCSLICNSLNAT